MTIAWATGGSFLPVSDPSELPDAFLNLRTTGVDSVTLSVNGSEPVPARLAGGTFAGSVPVEVGDNRIVAFATSLDGDTQESEIIVSVRDTSCAALEVAATNEGRPALSLNDRAVEIIVDASKSMWAQIDGRSKMEIAKTTLEEVSYWLPEDLDLALRTYGSTTASEQNNCADSSLLVPFGESNRDYVRQAIAGLRPTGQTPIAYALQQAARDFESLQSDLTLVLVSDGIESCGGDPVAAAHALRQQGIVVHLIGFGMGSAADEDTASLQAIANASGGRYVTAGSAEELKGLLGGKGANLAEMTSIRLTSEHGRLLMPVVPLDMGIIASDVFGLHDEDEAYERIRVIGSGAMGEVWLARHKMLDREVAIKTIRLSDGGASQPSGTSSGSPWRGSGRSCRKSTPS